jgi:hypothetical protein
MWIKAVPLKISILLGNFFLIAFPLKKTWFDVGFFPSNYQLCTGACGKNEDRDHLFARRDFYGKFWLLVSSWLGFLTIT